MTPQDQQTITRWSATYPYHREIVLIAGTDERDRKLFDFCSDLSQLTTRISFKSKPLENSGDLPVIVIGGRIRYHAVPSGLELKPFLSALAGETKDIGILPETAAVLSESALPSMCEVFITPQCPFCPDTVERLISIANCTSMMHVSVIDAALFPESAEEKDIKAVPTVILDSQYRWTGRIDISEVVDVILHRDPAQLSAQSIRGVIEDGKSAEIVRWMVGAGKVFSGLFELLNDEKWPIRLGAMVTFETLADEHPLLARTAVAPISALLPKAVAVAKGDMIYLLGVLGDHSVIPVLRSYQIPPYSAEIIEAAQEAIAAIEGRDGGG